jgi:hypothetical protein
MGCDYYITKYLKVNFQNNSPLCIQLERNKGYFYLDEDDPNYEEEYEKYVHDQLNPYMKPIIIYEKNQFVNSILENKYKLLIHNELDIYNKFHENIIELKDILDITKIETRFERN